MSRLLLVLLLLAAALPPSSLGRRTLDGPRAGSANARRVTELAGPGLSVRYFRGSGGCTEARLALELSSRDEPSEAQPRVSTRIREFQANGSRSHEIDIELERWIVSKSDPSLHLSRALLPPGPYLMELRIDAADRSIGIDRILDVPSFPEGELGVSSLVAALADQPSTEGAEAPRGPDPKVDGRFHRGRAIRIFAEAYPPTGSNETTAFSVRFRLRRGERVVREWEYDVHGEGKVALVETFETGSLEPGPYLLHAEVSPSSEEEGVSTRLELVIVDNPRGSRGLKTATFRNLYEML